MAKLVSKTYADALFELAVEKGCEDAWLVDCNASAFRKTTGIKCEEMITKRKEAQQEENDQII